MKKKDCTIRAAKTKAMISCAVTAQLICAFVFAYADCWFSPAAAHMCVVVLTKRNLEYKLAVASVRQSAVTAHVSPNSFAAVHMPTAAL